MKFENYPIDNHTCGIYFRTWINNASDVRLISGLLLFEKDFNLLDYSFDVQTIPTGSEKYNFSIAGFEIKLKRNINKYIANYYVPSGILVTISWVIKHFTKLTTYYLDFLCEILLINILDKFCPSSRFTW